MIGGIEFVIMGEPVPKARARVVASKTKSGKIISRSFTPETTVRAEQFVLDAFTKAVGHQRVGIYVEAVRAKPAQLPTKRLPALAARPGKPGYFTREPTFAMQPTEVEMEFYFSGAPIADVDNLAKLVLDALNRRAWRDDNKVMVLHVKKFFGQERPCTIVRIKRVGDPGCLCCRCGESFTYRRGPGDDAVVDSSMAGLKMHARHFGESR